MASSSVASAATSGIILAGNSERKGATIRNTDANILYIRLDDDAATTANAHYVLNSGDVLEVPSWYKGEINGIWSADGSGNAVVREEV